MITPSHTGFFKNNANLLKHKICFASLCLSSTVFVCYFSYPLINLYQSDMHVNTINPTFLMRKISRNGALQDHCTHVHVYTLIHIAKTVEDSQWLLNYKPKPEVRCFRSCCLYKFLKALLEWYNLASQAAQPWKSTFNFVFLTSKPDICSCLSSCVAEGIS